ncbi:hypothetical protein RI367_003093 [Sorochytrium milnesiophthora]
MTRIALLSAVALLLAHSALALAPINITSQLIQVGDIMQAPGQNVDYTIFKDDSPSQNLAKMHYTLNGATLPPVPNAALGARDLSGTLASIKAALSAGSQPTGRAVWTGSEVGLSTDMLSYMSSTECPTLAAVQNNTCMVCNNPNLSGTVVLSVIDNAVTSARAYLFADTREKKLVVAFRPTQNDENWVEDLIFVSRSYPVTVPFAAQSYAAQIQVHTGFWLVYDSLRSQLLPAFKTARQQYPTFDVIFAGFSLGGALATLAAAEYIPSLNLPTATTKLITIGSPRVGNVYFANMVDGLGIEVNRMTHENDLVPHAPPQSFGYQHVSGEKYSFQGVPYVCQGQEDAKCSNSRVPFLDYGAHKTIFASVNVPDCTV